MHKIKLYFIFILSVCCGIELQAIVYGDFAFVSRYPSSLFFPADDTNNMVRGFSQLQQGLVFEDSSTTCTINVFYPILGDLSLNGGTVYLNRNIILGSDGIIAGATVQGNNYSIEYTTTDNIHFPKQQSFASGTFLNLITQSGVAAAANSVDWSYDDKYICAGLSNGTVIVYSFDGTSLTQIQTFATGIGTLNDLRWQPGSYYMAAVGEGGAVQVRILQFDSDAGTITSVATASPGSVRACAWRPSGDYLLTFLNADPEIRIYSFTPPTLTAGPTVNLGTRFAVVRNSAAWDFTGQYFAVALQTRSFFGFIFNSQLLVFSFDGTSITEVAATAVYGIGGLSYGLDWSQSNGYITLGLFGNNFFGSGVPRYELWEFTAPSTLTQQTAGTITISGASARTPNSVMWGNGGDSLLFGSTTGGSGLYGFAAYDFNPSTNSFSILSGANPTVSIYSVRWSHNNQYIVRGDSGPNVGVYYGFALTAVPDLIVNDTKILLNSDSVVTGPILFQGKNEINATQHVVEFNGTDTRSKVILDDNASLFIENAILKNIQPDSIELGNTSNLSLKNVLWYQEGEVTFTQGNFDFYGDVVISGTGSFIYASDEASTIHEDSCLNFDSGMTFSYAATSSRDLLQFVDESSVLHLYETTLYSVVPGIQFKGGTIVVEGTCPVINNATDEAGGMLLGGGTSINNISLKILDESGFDVRSGYLVYKNV